MDKGKESDDDSHPSALRDNMKKGLSGRRSGHNMSAYFCGLDVHKESTYATVLSPDGDLVVQRRMPNEDVARRLQEDERSRLTLTA